MTACVVPCPSGPPVFPVSLVVTSLTLQSLAGPILVPITDRCKGLPSFATDVFASCYIVLRDVGVVL